MGKKPKGKKGMKMVVQQDLHGFNNQQNQDIKKQQEKDFQQVHPSGKGSAKDDLKGPSLSAQVTEANKCEEDVAKYQPEGDLSMQLFFQMDNKLIDAYYSKLENFAEDERDLLENEEFLHMLRMIIRDLEYVLSLRFSHFWGFVTKVPELQRFLDEFLQNARKHNDIYKIQFMDLFESDQQDSSLSQTIHLEIRQTMNQMLNLVLKVYYRLSIQMETDDQYFSLPFYSKLVYDNWLFDMPKLIDLAAIYGKSNHDTVMKIIQNVFDNEKKFVVDFVECFDQLIGQLKKQFRDFQKLQSMIKGDYISQISHEDQQQYILNYMTGYIEILSNFTLIITHFPESVLESIRNTNALLFLANSYCLTMHMKRDIHQILGIEIPRIKKNEVLQNVNNGYLYARNIQIIKKLCVQGCVQILQRLLLANIGKHSPNFAVVQNQLANVIKQFVLGVTGNNEVSKDVLPKTSNYMSFGDKTIGIPFIKRILKQVDLLSGIEAIEERFLPDGDKQFVHMVVESLSKGQKLQVKKVKAVQQEKANAQNHGSNHTAGGGTLTQTNSKFGLQDRENISQVFDMFSGQYSRQLIEAIYLKNDKNVSTTIDQCLNGNVPKDEYQVVIIDSKKNDHDTMQINTASHQTRIKDKSDLYQQYVIGAFEGSYARKNKNKQYYDQHIKAQEQIRYEEDNEAEDLKRKTKMLYQAQLMQYEDDFDDQDFYINRNKKRVEVEDSSDDETGKPTPEKKIILQKKDQDQLKQSAQGKRKGSALEEKDDEDDEDLDDMFDPTEKFIEKHESDANNDYLFQDDEKRLKREQSMKEEQQRRDKQAQQQPQNQRDQPNKGRGQKYDDSRRGGQYQQHDKKPYNDRGGHHDYQRGDREGGSGNTTTGGKPQYAPKYQPKGADQNTDSSQVSDRQQHNQSQRDDDYSHQQSYHRGGGGQGRGGNNYRDRNNDGNYSRRGGGGGGRGRGRGYSDNYQREEADNDRYYTSQNPLQGHDLENKYDEHLPPRGGDTRQNDNRDQQQNRQNDDYGSEDEEGGSGQNSGQYGGRGQRGRGSRGRGSRGNARGGHHNQKTGNLKKMGGGGSYY